MKITICGSMKFASEMQNCVLELEKLGYSVFAPGVIGKSKPENFQKKIDNNFIYKHYLEIKNSDAILVFNETKDEKINYIGANSFLEMGFAHVLKKKIYLLNPIPKQDYIYDEVMAFQPVVLNGNLEKIG